MWALFLNACFGNVWIWLFACFVMFFFGLREEGMSCSMSVDGSAIVRLEHRGLEQGNFSRAGSCDHGSIELPIQFATANILDASPTVKGSHNGFMLGGRLPDTGLAGSDSVARKT